MAWENKQLYNYGLIYVHKWVLKPSWLPLLLLGKKIGFSLSAIAYVLPYHYHIFVTHCISLTKRVSFVVLARGTPNNMFKDYGWRDKVKQTILELMKLTHFQKQ
jgi:hypothetical protein